MTRQPQIKREGENDMTAGVKIIRGLEEALALAILSNRICEGSLAQRTAKASEIIQALQEAGLEIRATRPNGKDESRAAGGHARAAILTAARRSEIAKRAAKKRWQS